MILIKFIPSTTRERGKQIWYEFEMNHTVDTARELHAVGADISFLPLITCAWHIFPLEPACEVCFPLLGRREIREEVALEQQGEQSVVCRGRKESRADQTDTPCRSPEGRSLLLGCLTLKAAGKTLFFSRADQTLSASQKPCQRPHPLASNGPGSPSRFPAAPAEAPPARSMLGF